MTDYDSIKVILYVCWLVQIFFYSYNNEIKIVTIVLQINNFVYYMNSVKNPLLYTI